MSEREHVYSDEGISPLGVIRVVSLQDPAVDLGAMGDVACAKYRDTRDPKHLRFHAGRESEATWYTLRPLTRQALNRYVEEATSTRKQCLRALACTIVRVENRVNHETGETITEPWEPQKFQDASTTLGCKVADDADIEKVVAMDDHIEEMGTLVYERSKLHPKERRACGLPHGSDRRISARLLDAVLRARAIAQAQASAP